MPETIAALIPFVTFLASTAGAGIAASWLFDQARRALPPTRAVGATPLLHWLLVFLYVPRYARLSVMVGTALISVAASATLAALTGQDVALAMDAALAVIIGQLRHGLSLPLEFEIDAPPAIAVELEGDE